MTLNQKLAKRSTKINQFNATHQVQVRPIDLRDTYQNKIVHPPQMDTPITFQTTRQDDSTIPLKGPPKKQDPVVILQIENEMAKLREQQLADQMAFENIAGSVTIEQRF